MSKASKEEFEKQAQEAADAKKSPEEKMKDAERNCREAGKRFCGRILGMLDREIGRLVDQFEILEDSKIPTKIVTETFLGELDKVRERRSFQNKLKPKTGSKKKGKAK